MHDCVIVGAGPGGLVAATYLQRFRRDIVVVDAGQSRARYIPVSHNCPGYPEGVSGTELLRRLRCQAARHEVRIVEDRVLRIEPQADGFVAHAEGRSWSARTVIVATGVVDRLPHWEGLEAAIASGLVRLCAVCDGFEVRGQRIAVFGDGLTGVLHACFMRTYAHEVTLIHPPGQTPSAEHRALAAELDVALLPASAEQCNLDGDAFVVATDDMPAQRFDVVYINLGAPSQSGLVKGLVQLSGKERDLEVDASCETSVPGIFGIGDVVSALNQVSVAFGHAAIAASAVHQRLARNPVA